MAASHSGQVLGQGRFLIGRELGRGGMGIVYEAHDQKLGQRVAIKILHPHLVERRDLVERFTREAHAAAALQHPFIVQVKDFGEEPDGTVWIVMEHLSGRSVADHIRDDGMLSADRAAAIARDALLALEAAHTAGIVHRDIKPDNVFLVSVPGIGEVVKLLDFGIAKLTEESVRSKLTATGSVVGTPAYMSPEQARGRLVDARTDIYSVGAVMYEALSGRVPFVAENYNALLFAIFEEMPAPLSALRPDVDPAIIAIVERAMSKDPAYRHQTAGEMAQALDPFAAPLGRISGARASAVAPISSWQAPPAYGTPYPQSGTPYPAQSGTPYTPPIPVPYVQTPPVPQPPHATTPAPVTRTAHGSPRRSSWPRVALIGALGLLAIVGTLVVVAALALRGEGTEAQSLLERPIRTSRTVEPRVLGTDAGVAAQLLAATQAVPDAGATIATAPPAGLRPPRPSGSRGSALGDKPNVVAGQESSDQGASTQRGRTRTGGPRAQWTGCATNNVYTIEQFRAGIAALAPRYNRCYERAEYAAADHIHTTWFMEVSDAGAVTRVWNNDTATMDQITEFRDCMFEALRHLELGAPQSGHGGEMQVSLSARLPGD